MTKDPKRFYIYAWLRHKTTDRGKKGSPYYIGKGSGGRAWSKSGRVIKKPKDESLIVMLRQGLTENEAFRWEMFYIAHYGRLDKRTGILHNRTDGGEGASGAIPKPISEEVRQKMSRSQKGRRHEAETRKKMSMRAMGQGNAFWGRRHSDEARAKMSASRTGLKRSEEVRRKMSESAKGRRHTDESKAKLAKARERYEYEVIGPDGTIFITRNLSKFSIDNGLRRNGLHEVVKGKSRHHRGWVARVIRELK
jgi:hypothetical protein